MRDLLPLASVGIGIPVSQFFSEIMSVIDELPGLTVDHQRTPRASFDQELLDIECNRETMHQGLCGMMIAASTDKRVRVEVRAKRWDGQDRPDYDTYVQSLRLIFQDVLQPYNRKFKRHYRLAIPSRERCEPKLSPKTKIAFDHFVGSANKSCLHALDWDRFYRFVRRCHKYRVHTNEVDLNRLLWKAGFSESHAAELSEIYIRLRQYSEVR